MFCYKCGSQQQDGANFCHVCGADLRRFSETKNDNMSFNNKNVSESSSHIEISGLNKNANSIKISNVNENVNSNLSGEDSRLSGSFEPEKVASELVSSVADIKNITDCRKRISLLGVFAFVLGIIEVLFVVTLIVFSDFKQIFFFYDILKMVACVLPFVNLILSVVAIYKDRHIESVIAAFFLNFAIFLFMIMYFGYSLFIRFF